MAEALIVIDYINDICNDEGKLAGKGYPSFMKKHGTIKHVRSTIKKAKDKNMKVIFVKVEFEDDYSDQPKKSPLFGKADEFQALKKGSWGTQAIDELKEFKPDITISKNRMNAFSNPEFRGYLVENNIRKAYLAGVSTDIGVLTTAANAHDNDYEVFIVSKACAAANDEDHGFGLKNMSKYCTVIEEL